MDLGLQGRGALVLGAGSGLGAAIAVALGREGAHVVAAGRTAAHVEATAATIVAAGGAATPLVLDLRARATFAAAVAAAVAAAEAAAGTLDILVNNTGGPPAGTAGGVDPAVWQEQFEAMVLSVFALTDLVLPGMRERGWGRVLTSTSSGTVVPIPQLGISNALRAALHGWSKTLAAEVADDGVTVNVLVPGRIATARTEALDAGRAAREGRPVADVEQDSRARIPVGRYGRPEEYGDAAAFLASARASYITGAVLRVDGGLIGAV
jgi:3-oxoacyl-[acyl-carrier protein] reductase